MSAVSRGWLPLLLTICIGAGLPPREAIAFSLLSVPPAGPVTMNLSLSEKVRATGYGPQSDKSIATMALNRWNEVGIGAQPDHAFFSVRTPTVAGSLCMDGVNEVRASPTLCGRALGDTLGLTVSRFFVGGKVVEVDVVVNSDVLFDAYPGPLRLLPIPVYDLFRVLLHEFGHAAGLDHPDEAGQQVTALMNSRTSDVDNVQVDDIEGAHAVCWHPTVDPPTSLVAAVLPTSRSVVVGQAATAFATIINAGRCPAKRVAIALNIGLPATLTFQTTDPATNLVTGTANTAVDIAPGGSQSFVLALQPAAPVDPVDVSFNFAGTNGAAVPLPSVNTLLFSASTTAVPDVIALVATLERNGIVRLTGAGRSGFFAVATTNVGSGGASTVSADTGNATLPIAITICQTVPSTGACLAPPQPAVVAQIDTGATPTFAIFATATGPVAFDPAVNRIFVRFRDTGGAVRGATSVAVTSP